MNNSSEGVLSDDPCNNITDPVRLLGLEVTYAIAVPIPCLILMILGIFGNSLVIVVVTTNKHMRNDINFLITNLAVNDLLFLIIVMPSTILRYTYPSWLFGVFFCKFIRYTLYVTAYNSVYTMVSMSLIRFYVIMYPVRANYILKRYYLVPKIIGVTWLVTLCVNTPALIFHYVENYSFDCQERSGCQLLPEQLPTFSLYFFIFGYVLPLLMISICYGFILVKLQQNTQIGERRTVETAQGRKHATYLVFAIVLIFTICWLPAHVMALLDHTFRVEIELGFKSRMAVNIICNMLVALSSTLNPVLYSFLSENYRDAFKRFFCRKQSKLIGKSGRRSFSYAECPQQTCDTSVDKRVSSL